MRDLLGKNLTYKLVAIFLAVVLWMNASDQDTGFRQQVVEVPLEVRSISSSLVASKLPEKVRVRFEGEWDMVEQVEANQFSAFVRLDSYQAGTHQVPVEVTVPPGLRLVNISPASISVRLTQMTSVQVPVKVDVKGGAAAGYTMLSPVVEPAEAIVSGPEEILERISSARVRVSLNDAVEDYVKVLPLIPQGAKIGQGQVTIQPATAKVTIPIIREIQTKTVPIEVTVEGTLMEGYTLGRVAVQPQQVEISGDPEVIRNITSIKTFPVAVQDKEARFTETVALNVPQGVEVGHAQANVTVEILKQEQEE